MEAQCFTLIRTSLLSYKCAEIKPNPWVGVLSLLSFYSFIYERMPPASTEKIYLDVPFNTLKKSFWPSGICRQTCHDGEKQIKYSFLFLCLSRPVPFFSKTLSSYKLHAVQQWCAPTFYNSSFLFFPPVYIKKYVRARVSRTVNHPVYLVSPHTVSRQNAYLIFGGFVQILCVFSYLHLH